MGSAAYATKYYPLTRSFVKTSHPIPRRFMKTDTSTPSQSFASANYSIARSLLTNNYPRSEDLVNTSYTTARSFFKTPYTSSRNIAPPTFPTSQSISTSYYPTSSRFTTEESPKERISNLHSSRGTADEHQLSRRATNEYLTSKRDTPLYESITNEYHVTSKSERPPTRGKERSDLMQESKENHHTSRVATPDYHSALNDYQASRNARKDYRVLRGTANDYQSSVSTRNDFLNRSRGSTPEEASIRRVAAKERTPCTTNDYNLSEVDLTAYQASRNAVSDYLASRRAANGLPPTPRSSEYKGFRSAQQDYDKSKSALSEYQTSRDVAIKERSKIVTPNHKRATPDHRITTPEYHISKGARNDNITSRNSTSDHPSSRSASFNPSRATPERKIEILEIHHPSRASRTEHHSSRVTPSERPTPPRVALGERSTPQRSSPRPEHHTASRGSASSEMPVHWPGRSSSCTPRELKKIITDPSGGYLVIPFDAYNEVYPGIYIGDMHTALCTQELVHMGVTHVLNAAQKDSRPDNEQAPGYYVNTNPGYYSRADIKYLGVPATDSINFDLSQYFEKSAAFIEKALAKKGKVLVHCHQGISRSATLALAFLMMKRGMSVQEAMRTVRAKREIIPNPSFLRQLCELNDKLTGGRRRFQDMGGHM